MKMSIRRNTFAVLFITFKKGDIRRFYVIPRDIVCRNGNEFSQS